MTLHVNYANGVAIVRPQGMLLDGGETDAFETEIRQQLTADPVAILVDLGDTQHVCSRAFGIMHYAATQAAEKGMRFALCGASPRITASLAALRLTASLKLFGSRQEFLDQLKTR